jgi:alkanesulfonate monooxygenase SsuD/methylene tetrahydromethanopterin reductase-like flavin-dependent oxidoreductase (luciferase family)
MGAAAGPATLTHMVEFCDGWMPLGTRHGLSDLPAVRRALAASGRDPDSFEITLYHAKAESRVLEELVEKGIHRVVFTLPQRSPAEVLERLKRLAEVVAAHPA